MSRSQSDDSWVILVIGAVVAIAAYIVWQFSTFFGLDMASGGSVFLRLVLLVVLAGACWKFGDDFDLIGSMWPVLLALLWACWWPALDFWASKEITMVFRREDAPTIWWGAWYTKWGVFLSIIGLGYLFKKLMDD